MSTPPPESNWKTRALFTGTMFGTVFGFVAAYLYTRAAEEDQRAGGSPQNRIQTGDLIGLGLALLGVVRQIAELGRSPQRKK